MSLRRCLAVGRGAFGLATCLLAACPPPPVAPPAEPTEPASGAEAEAPPPPLPPDAWAQPPGGDWTAARARAVVDVVPDAVLARLGVTLEDGSRWVVGLVLEPSSFRVLQLERREALPEGEPAPAEVLALVSEARPDVAARWIEGEAVVPPAGAPPGEEELAAFARSPVVTGTVLDVAVVAEGEDGARQVIPLSPGPSVGQVVE